MYKTPARTLFLGKNLVFVPECHSTNTLALQLCQASGALAEGTVVITDRQTAGRGQRGNAWQATPGLNLTFSLVFKPVFLGVMEQYDLNRAIALGVRDYLATRLMQPVHIKWPNDVLVDARKVSGILIENVVQGSSIRYAVAGIGLNVNQQQFEHPRAASMISFTGMTEALADVLEELLLCVEARYLALRQGQRDRLRNDYHQALFGLGQRRIFESAGQSFTGTVVGVDNTGRLLIDGEGAIKAFEVKEVSFSYDGAVD